MPITEDVIKTIQNYISVAHAAKNYVAAHPSDVIAFEEATKWLNDAETELHDAMREAVGIPVKQ